MEYPITNIIILVKSLMLRLGCGIGQHSAVLNRVILIFYFTCVNNPAGPWSVTVGLIQNSYEAMAMRLAATEPYQQTRQLLTPPRPQFEFMFTYFN